MSTSDLASHRIRHDPADQPPDSPLLWLYESHFGLSGRPFATTPDLGFYFDGEGHRRALGHLRFAILAGEPCTVVTGDIGAGKTTLLQKLLGELPPNAVQAALVVGTRLDAAALLRAALAAFRVPVAGESADELRQALHDHGAQLEAAGRRGLLVVDEAQHLLPDAIACLQRLCERTGSDAGRPLQVLLCGQPELRAALRPLPDAAVSLLCHLPTLSEAETRAYIEHRLRRVGWSGVPSFADEAHARIFAATRGVPRRVNRLCDRLLTAAFRRRTDSLSAALVSSTEAELRCEMGELPTVGIAATAPAAAPVRQPARAGAVPPAGAIPRLMFVVGDDKPSDRSAPAAAAKPVADERAAPASLFGVPNAATPPEPARDVPVVRSVQRVAKAALASLSSRRRPAMTVLGGLLAIGLLVAWWSPGAGVSGVTGMSAGSPPLLAAEPNGGSAAATPSAAAPLAPLPSSAIAAPAAVPAPAGARPALAGAAPLQDFGAPAAGPAPAAAAKRVAMAQTSLAARSAVAVQPERARVAPRAVIANTYSPLAAAPVPAAAEPAATRDRPCSATVAALGLCAAPAPSAVPERAP